MITGALGLVETALNAGVEICFANPGTTEMQIVTALERVAGMRVVLGLFEGVCTGAADGWGRMKRAPAATLLHLGPGFANGIANLHNARRAGTPVINWIGDHASYHLKLDAPLTSDIAALAGSVGWTATVPSSGRMSEASLDAVKAALGAPGRVASLIIPADCQWEDGSDPLNERPVALQPDVSVDAVKEAARLLKMSLGGILLGGSALSEAGQRSAARIAAATGCGVWIETFPARKECGCNLPIFPSLPYFPEKAAAALSSLNSLVLAGARKPISFFAYKDQPSSLFPEDRYLCNLAGPDQGIDAAAALAALADELAAPKIDTMPRSVHNYSPINIALTPDILCGTLAALTPENAIVVNEAATTGLTWNMVHSNNAAPHTMLFLTGGAIGQGLPNALGAALACPDRRVIAFQADGSGLYTVQALWSMAREGVDVTVVVCANRKYRILQAELARAGITEPGPKAHALTDLGDPAIDWASVARGFGVPGSRVETDTQLVDALVRSFKEKGPSLIEAVIS